MTSSHLRATTLAAALLVLATGLAGCGSDAKANADHTRTPSTSLTPTPTPTPTPTATATPLSGFESRPPVQALRSWAAAAARDVNARRHDFPTASKFEVDTAKVRSDVAVSWQEDFGRYYPGPLPFTPVAVGGSGGQARVSACVIGSGFALRKPHGKPAEKRGVIPVMFTMARQGHSWLLAGIAGGTADCAGVRIKGVQW